VEKRTEKLHKKSLVEVSDLATLVKSGGSKRIKVSTLPKWIRDANPERFPVRGGFFFDLAPRY
jgi:hypothetical protein